MEHLGMWEMCQVELRASLAVFLDPWVLSWLPRRLILREVWKSEDCPFVI